MEFVFLFLMSMCEDTQYPASCVADIEYCIEDKKLVCEDKKSESTCIFQACLDGEVKKYYEMN